MKTHCISSTRLAAAWLAVALVGTGASAGANPPAATPQAASSAKKPAKPLHPRLTPESIQRVAPPARPNSGTLLIQPGEAVGSLATHSAGPGPGRSDRALPIDRSSLVSDDTSARR